MSIRPDASRGLLAGGSDLADNSAERPTAAHPQPPPLPPARAASVEYACCQHGMILVKSAFSSTVPVPSSCPHYSGLPHQMPAPARLYTQRAFRSWHACSLIVPDVPACSRQRQRGASQQDTALHIGRRGAVLMVHSCSGYRRVSHAAHGSRSAA